jgi:hypothetical protein
MVAHIHASPTTGVRVSPLSWSELLGTRERRAIGIQQHSPEARADWCKLLPAPQSREKATAGFQLSFLDHWGIIVGHRKPLSFT